MKIEGPLLLKVVVPFIVALSGFVLGQSPSQPSANGAGSVNPERVISDLTRNSPVWRKRDADSSVPGQVVHPLQERVVDAPSNPNAPGSIFTAHINRPPTCCFCRRINPGKCCW